MGALCGAPPPIITTGRKVTMAVALTFRAQMEQKEIAAYLFMLMLIMDSM